MKGACNSQSDYHRFKIPLNGNSCGLPPWPCIDGFGGKRLWVHGISPSNRPNYAVPNSGTWSVPKKVDWQNVAPNLAAVGNTLTKTSQTVAWDVGASSTRQFQSVFGSVEWIAENGLLDRMAGLSNGDSHYSFDDIDYAFYTFFGGTLCIYEKGYQQACNWTYSAGDRLRVALEYGAVKYYKNGVLLWIATAPAPSLRVGTSLARQNAKIENVIISGSLY